MYKVCLVEDNPDARQLLVDLMQHCRRLRLLGLYASGEEALKELPKVIPDVVLMDIRMPGMSGIDCVSALRRLPSLTHCPVLMLTEYDDPALILEAFRAGATGYLLKRNLTGQELQAAVIEVMTGGAPMSPSVARKVVASFHEHQQGDALSGLTAREREVLDLLTEGLAYKQIAGRLAISLNTVHQHLRHVYSKLGVQTRNDPRPYSLYQRRERPGEDLPRIRLCPFFPEWYFSETERIGELITYDYDLFARKTNEVHWDINDVAVMTNSFAYNAAGDLTALTDGKVQITTWKHDEFGRVTNKLDAASAELFRYSYDANSRLTTRWTPEKLTTAYSYDAMGNLTLVNYTVSPDVTLHYDALNRVTNMVDAVGATIYSFTAFGALQSEDGPWADDTVSHSYTANRLRSGLSLTHPSASGWSQSYAYDAANRLSSVTSPAGTFGYEYKVGQVSSPASLIKKLTLPGGSSITNHFDEQARWLETKLLNSQQSTLNFHSYDYNDLDHRTKQTRKDGDFVEYGYDALGQVVDATGKESGGTPNRWQERFFYSYDVLRLFFPS